MRTILFAGGGTLGPVAPLLAVAARLEERDHHFRFAWAGTDHGPERDLVEDAGIHFATIPVAKLPRYLSWKLVTAPFDYARARQEAARLLDEARPVLVLSAGGYTAVPVITEAAKRGIPCLAHQLDYRVGLSNRMVAKQCRYVTVSFEYPVSPFPVKVQTYQIPTPVRFASSDVPSRDFACRYFGFNPSQPVLLVVGGGTGAKTLNETFAHIRHRLPADLQILHITGRGKSEGIISETPSYVVNEFLGSDMVRAYAAADLVVSRAGVGAISELAVLKKPTIFVPLPDSPQDANVSALGTAIRAMRQTEPAFPLKLQDEIIHLLNDADQRTRLGASLHTKFPTDKGEALAALAMNVIG
jgi:UDP-N-acetylglucosamine--N-acetylmuramyl-(pentapeptide) pyrophosphoryl-undecaprenol N-acetylglucosamine transferase